MPDAIAAVANNAVTAAVTATVENATMTAAVENDATVDRTMDAVTVMSQGAVIVHVGVTDHGKTSDQVRGG